MIEIIIIASTFLIFIGLILLGVLNIKNTLRYKKHKIKKHNLSLVSSIKKNRR